MLSQPSIPLSVLTTPHANSNADQIDNLFRKQALETLGQLRTSIEQIIHPFAKGLQNSRDLQKHLGVDRNLSWQIFKLLGPVETLATPPYVPAPVSMRKLLQAVRKKGVSAKQIDEAEAAFAAYEQLVRDYAGDRERFETMAMSLSDSVEAQQVDLQHRKAAFKAHSHFFGSEVDAHAVAIMCHSSSTSGHYDQIALRSLVGLRRLRMDTEVIIDRWKIANDPASQDIFPFKPLVPEAAKTYGAPILPSFCSQPIPPLVAVTESSGMPRTLLKSKEIGVGQEIDVAIGRTWSQVPIELMENGQSFIMGAMEVSRPTKLLVVDYFLHRPIFPDMIPSNAVCAHLYQRTFVELENEAIRLPMRERFTRIGSGWDAVRIREIPRYSELLRYACDHMGWKFEEMDLYRFRMEYPLMDTEILFKLEAPKSR